MEKVMRESASERNDGHQGVSINDGNSPEAVREASEEEKDLLARNIKKRHGEEQMDVCPQEDEQTHMDNDEKMEEAERAREKTDNKEAHHEAFKKIRTPISYKAKLMGREEKAFSQDLDALMQEWLKEEDDTAPLLSDAQREMINTLPKIDISDDRLREMCKPWKDALILTLLGKPTNLNMMKDRISLLLKTGSFELIDLPNKYYVFRCEDKELCRKLLFEGPWSIQGHYLAVQRWSPNFNPYCNRVRKVAIWVRVPTLPMHCYSEECLLELGNMIGKALKVDMNTLAQCTNMNTTVERGKFARVSVGVDLNKPLQARFVIRRRIFTVEYEGLDTICFKCGLYGHRQEDCPLNKQPVASSPENITTPFSSGVSESEKKEKQPLVSVPGVGPDEAYGSWMKATKTFRQKPMKTESERKNKQKAHNDGKSTSKEQRGNTGTRFSALYEDQAYVTSENIEYLSRNREPVKEWRKKEGKEKHEKREDKIYQNGHGADLCGSPNETAGQNRPRAENEKEKMATEEGVDSTMKKKKEKISRDKVGSSKANDGPMVFSANPSQESSSNAEDTNKKKESKKRNQSTRPKIISPLLKKQQAKRAHNVTFGSLNGLGPLDFNKAIPIDLQEHVGDPPQQEKWSNPHQNQSDSKIHSTKEPPDIRLIPNNFHHDKNIGEATDCWFETHDDVKDVFEEKEGSSDVDIIPL